MVPGGTLVGAGVAYHGGTHIRAYGESRYRDGLHQCTWHYDEVVGGIRTATRVHGHFDNGEGEVEIRVGLKAGD